MSQSRGDVGLGWEPGEWFAVVLEAPRHAPEGTREVCLAQEPTGRPVSFYHGAPKKGEEVIEYLEATLKDPIQGATSWGFSR